jgi:arabinan endo-1,5-alpha-L-arabinosidase
VAMIRARVHDPSNPVNIGHYLMLFASAVRWHYYDLDTKTWAYGGELYDANELSTGPSRPTEGRFWAPHVAPCPWSPGNFVIYHSDVTCESNHESKISLAVSSGKAPNPIWTAGNSYVVESKGYSMPFAIDPSVFEDDDGSFWLIYGSHAKGIVTVELDPATGYLKVDPENKFWSPDDTRFSTIANYGGSLDENNVEAAYLYKHGGYYYLYVNWDVCCHGVDSSYSIRIGRSLFITGPYLDKDGADLASGGGTVFLDANGEILGDSRFIGPGHAGIYQHTDGRTYFSHHFYDGKSEDDSGSLAVWVLKWGEDGWPYIDTEDAVSF